MKVYKENQVLRPMFGVLVYLLFALCSGLRMDFARVAGDNIPSLTSMELLIGENGPVSASFLEDGEWSAPGPVHGLVSDNFAPNIVPTQFIGDQPALPVWGSNDRSMLIWDSPNPSDVEGWNTAATANPNGQVRHQEDVQRYPRSNKEDDGHDGHERNAAHPVIFATAALLLTLAAIAL